MTSKYVPVIDGLRAIAILTVMSSHFISSLIPGGVGVTLFFFISGYLITGLLIDEQSRSGSIDLKSFYLRRFLRLAPALAVMVSVVSLVYLLAFNSTSAKELAAALLYFMNYYEIAHGAMPVPLGPLWSLAIEEHFYLVFPVLIALLWRFRERLFFGLAALCVAVLVWRAVLVASGAPDVRTYVGTDTRIDSILFGSLLAMAIRLNLRIDWLGSKVTVAAGVLLLLASLAIRNPFFRETVRYSLQGLAFFPIFYFILTRASPIRTLLETRVFNWTGKISYSLYLWHFPTWVFTTTQIEFGNPLNAIIVATIGSFVLAATSFYFVETPLRKRRVGSQSARKFQNPRC